ncbi:ribosome hibernation-promoting factor, HPF/YfiA family [Shewanella litorisediminis]|uniref:Ribosome-associated translation inhibitor RaiA n=1 Tax=Shewanella litorisediminis TaxID=1173586 RepID=A0ABX7G632_9GAMM|nr:ribosome-associated translation inhibitor RaiA [Shewanella litorisediminis]MCL2917516.1 ribosome-associated translation inhibitor RaiA [Shewanella litorisediminis]QRH02645.1 ribosome-associated translation inhibitor RaiA [Shewanella litorisediminis]
MLKITSKQFEVTTPIRERVESRFEKLARHDVPLINPHIIISQEKALFKIEASVGVPQGDLFAQAKSENLYAAITAMGQKLEKQLNRLTHKPEAKRADTQGVAAEEVDFEYDYKEEYAA